MAVLVLVATSVVGAISYRSTSARLIAEVDDSISEATTLLAGRGDDNRFRIPARGLLGIYSVRVLNVRAETVNSSFEVDLPVSDAARSVVGVNRGFDQSTVEFGSERFRVHTVGRDAGAVQVARSLGETDRVLRDVQRRTALFVLVVSSLAAAVGWLLASTVAAPLRRLTRAASEVEQSGDLNVALPEPGRDEVGRLGSAFGSMLGALQRSRGEQQRLVQDAGHELRTPLTSLRTNLAVLRRHPDMEPDMQERILEDLDSEVGELTELVNELVAVASGELADQPPQDLLLAEVARRVAARVGRRRDRSVVVEVGVHVGEEASVFAPLAGIERAITNLVENAAKFDQSDSEIRVEVDGGRLTVIDHGPGIPEDDLPLVFDRFHRATASRTLPGSGLGLAIVREIVERHGGTVSAVNRPGGGASVGFELPVQNVPTSATPA
ncbi:MAG: HAMP domain-containing histidine kinase [Ilumatobacter sp.]|uniref:HAMP domain-containing sensor histidine kinase n=1 Tax=Ilumatobacter sp. TaxID=1967498 RepID=UPI002A348CB8|nr:HAMP domain-containing histidine kinase [Ilumatobacter sp.]MBT5555066.1 HAMP domain-containing histidine kinase [Ilumatobacter sp.]MBT5865411.1 HAMP domain-containing histidine kinase [Ilumatobacter sp.]MDG0976270.1 HAMP domain-containing sensor histidine kinase [Ilumatobacter sp.]